MNYVRYNTSEILGRSKSIAFFSDYAKCNSYLQNRFMTTSTNICYIHSTHIGKKLNWKLFERIIFMERISFRCFCFLLERGLDTKCVMQEIEGEMKKYRHRERERDRGRRFDRGKREREIKMKIGDKDNDRDREKKILESEGRRHKFKKRITHE